MKIVVINYDFRDVYTGKIHKAGTGKTEIMTDERIAEIKAVNPDFITVVGVVKDEEPETPKTAEAPKKSGKAGKA